MNKTIVSKALLVNRKFLIALSVALLVSGTGIAYSMQPNANTQDKTTASPSTKKQPNKTDDKKAAQPQAQASSVPQSAAATPVAKAATPSIAKSAAPKSAPVAAPAALPDINIAITSPGQMPAGTPIVRTKYYQVIYGGDLIASQQAITISLSQPGDRKITFSAPDGRVIGVPNMPWNAPKIPLAIGQEISDPATGTSVKGYLSTISGVAPGTYMMHVTTGSSAGDNFTSWQYDAFIAITIVP